MRLVRKENLVFRGTWWELGRKGGHTGCWKRLKCIIRVNARDKTDYECLMQLRMLRLLKTKGRMKL